MKVLVSWLKEYIKIEIPVAELAERLTMAGSEVKAVTNTAEGWEGITVAGITKVEPHPNADRLRLATVNTGDGEITVVCGAPNLKVGDKIAFAPAGSCLKDPKTGKEEVLKEATIRGVTSAGMICSEKELGISENHEGIMVLPSETPLGSALSEVLADSILDLDITPNRPDCLSIIGIAREAAALTEQKPEIEEPVYEEEGPPVGEQISVEIDDEELCPRYSCSFIKGITLGESPQWLKDRLIACGMRPINNVVDITNYVLLEYGQPLHAFDYDKLKGKKIIVRPAAEGETFVTLDGVARKLGRESIVIADAERSVAIAGVMGGANSEVDDKTTTIILESASFKPSSIHYTSHNLRLTSEASSRFERGISSDIALPALKRATQLILEMAGGQAAVGVVDEYPGKRSYRSVEVTTDMVRTMLGKDITIHKAGRILQSLGFSWYVESDDEGGDYGGGETYRAFIPYWRSDINHEVDAIEEIARIYGYDNIPTTLMAHQLPHQVTQPMVGFKRRVRQLLTGYGFQEVVSFSLTSQEVMGSLRPDGENRIKPVRLANPLSSEQDCLRTSLRAGVLQALADNRRHEEGAIRLFELGRVYRQRKEAELPYEPEMLSIIMSGSTVSGGWEAGQEDFDFYHAKGLAEALLAAVGVTAEYQVGEDDGLRLGSQAFVVVENIPLGVIGELHPKVAHAFELEGPVFVCDINLTSLMRHCEGHVEYHPVPRYPAIVRDLAIVVENKVAHKLIAEIIADFPLVKNLELFDVYTGKQIGEGKKSLAYRLTFQSAEQTLTDEEANKVQQQILCELSAKLGATLRG